MSEITPENIARMRYDHSLDGQAIGNAGEKKEIYDLFEQIAKEKGWDLDEVEWVQFNGTKMRGNQVKEDDDDTIRSES